MVNTDTVIHTTDNVNALLDGEVSTAWFLVSTLDVLGHGCYGANIPAMTQNVTH